jgi:type III secretory pathway component EscV
MEGLDKLPWGTILGGIIVVIVAGVGGAVTIIKPETLSFSAYVSSLSDLAVGVGLVTVGRGVTKAGKHIGKDDVSR